MSKSCKNCLLTDKIETISIDKDGLCDYCAERKKDEWVKRFNVTEEKKTQLRKKLKEIYKDARGKSDYDCTLSLSGGKDSSYLLYHLAVERKMKVLAVHVKALFGSKIAWQNVKLLKKAINFDLEVIDPGIEFYTKFYRTLFLNPVKEGYLVTICTHCGQLTTGSVLKCAVERKIPLVISGLSPHQADFVFFEYEKDTIKNIDWTPDIFKTEEFDDEFRDKFWNPLTYPKTTAFPRLILPLHVMKYNIENIKEKLAKKKILPKEKSHTLVGNCALLTILTYLDIQLLGYNPFIKEYSFLIRKGYLPKDFWKKHFRRLDLEVMFGTFLKMRGQKMTRAIKKKLGIVFSNLQLDKNSIERSCFQETPYKDFFRQSLTNL